jgi:hypothetical protein
LSGNLKMQQLGKMGERYWTGWTRVLPGLDRLLCTVKM